MTITELSIKRPSLIIIIFVALTVVGLFCYKQLKYELLPKFSPPVITVTSVYPGASPEEVQTNVSKPIENVVAGVEKAAYVRSTSTENVSFVTIEFQQDADVDVAMQDVQRKVLAIAANLPKEVKTPAVSKIALDETPVLRMGITGTMPSKDFYQFLQDNVLPRLATVPGVGDVVVLGGDARELKVNLNLDKLKSFSLSVPQVAAAVKMANIDVPTGKLKDGNEQFIVRLAGKFGSVAELKLLPVGISRSGGEIRLGDVAEIQDGVREVERINRINGNNSIGLLIIKQADANAVETVAAAKIEIASLEKDYLNIKLKFDIAQDSSDFTLKAAQAVQHDLIIAIILVAAVMLIFLHSLRNSLIVMIAIPASLVSTFIAMYLFGFSLNLMTLLALSLVIGILVDDSIVVLENIYRHLEMGKNPREAALEGRNEIGFTAMSITLVDVVVFFPLSVLPGVVGGIMRQFAVVTLVSTLMSLVVSFTITPMLASRFSRVQHLTKGTLMGYVGLWFEAQFSALVNVYEVALRWSLRNKILTTVLVIASFVGAVQLVQRGYVTVEFIRTADRGEFSVLLEMPPGSTVANTNRMSQRVEMMLSKMPQVKKIYANVGASSEGFFSSSSNNISELVVTLVPLAQRQETTNEMMRIVKRKVSDIEGVKARLNAIGIFGTANFTPFQLVVAGSNMDSVRKATDMIENIILKTVGTADVRTSLEDGKPETRIEVDRVKLATFGLSMAEIGQTLQIALRGDDDAKIRDGSNEYTLRILLDEFDKSQTSSLENLTFINRKGEQIELKQFASIKQGLGPGRLQRENRNAAVTIFSQAVGRGVADIAADVNAAILKAGLPQGVKATYTGDVKNQKDSAASMGMAVLAALIFVYMIMVALYDNFVYPLVVLFSIPLAVGGAFLALGLSLQSLNIFTQLGLIMLVGLVAKNAILLVDFANEAKTRGFSSYDALIEAGKERLRPILMTTVAMVIGMFPIAMGGGAGTEWKQGLAWVLIGGLTSSMFLTLVYVPIVYLTVDSVLALFKRLTAKK